MANAKELGFLSGGGEMGARMRALDWTRTPVGPPETWPQSLRSPLSMLLPSKAQIILFWGPQYVSFYNDAYIPVFGGKHPKMLGQPGSVAWSEIWDDGVALRRLLDGVVRTGEAFTANDLLFTIERHGFVEDTYFDVSYDPVRDESGAVGGVFCIVTETTGRVVGERRLGLLRSLSAHNASARTVRDACAFTMETLAAHPMDVAFALAYLGDTLQAATPGAEEAWAAAPPERVKELALPGGRLVVGVNPRRAYDQHYVAFLALVADQIGTAVVNARAYEEQRERAEALAELDRAKTTFFSNVSHEFRTPLTLMLGPLEDALGAPDLAVAEREGLEVAQRNARRLLKLVNTLLDFSRIEASRLAVRLEATELGAFTAELASVFRSTVERAGLRLVVDCPPLGQSVPIDREMWEKVVLNLLSNAFKFTFEGEIVVRVRSEGGRAILSVADTGIGIPPQELPHVFERFHRVKDARGRSFEGSGIGLALVDELVRLQGGEVKVSSVPGAGTTFTVAVPLAAEVPVEMLTGTEPPPSASTRAAAVVEEIQSWLPADPVRSAAPAGAARPRILLADDNADMRRYLHRLLDTDYDVVAVSDGLAAVEAARSSRFDLVLTDVMMPKLDGYELIEALRRDERTRTLPIMLLSARAGEDSRVEGMAAGADEYLVKPFSARELLVRVGALLRAEGIRSEAHRAVRESEERFRAFVSSVSDVVYRMSPDWGEMRQLDGRRFIADTLEPNRGWMEKYIHPDDRAKVRAAIDEAIRSKKIFELEHRVFRVGGSLGWTQSRAIPLLDGAGEIVEWIGAAADVTARKRAEDALREEARMLETLNRVGRMLAAETDLEKTVQAVTDAATAVSGARFGAFFYNVKKDAGESYLLFTISGAPREAFEKFGMPRNTAVFAATFGGTGTVRVDDITKDPRYGHNAPHHGMPQGHLPVVSYLAVPVVSQANEVIGGLFLGHPEPGVFTARAERLVESIAAQAAVAFDKAQLYEQRAQLVGKLQEADRHKDEFLATLSHELRNPLAPLRNALHLLRASEGEASAPIHDIMDRQLEHLVRLVDDLLEVSRISRGVLDLRRERIDVSEVVRNAVETSRPHIDAGRHQLELELPPERIWLDGDPVRLAQILSNLLNNAAKYTDPGGRIALSVRRADGAVTISVRDDGPGVPPDLLPHIFVMFSRGDRKSARQQGGLGIGLALSRRLAGMHGGSLDLKDNGPGQGAEFVVTLPAASEQEPVVSSDARVAASLPARRVLVVDDNRDSADSLAMVLQLLGADARVARDGPEALEAYESYAPAVVLLDIGMPGMDGYEVAREIRRRHPERRAALVALTGWSQDEDRQRAREAGFDRHLVKPADIGALRTLLSSL
jgi:signal transduction histidine kinase/DNA-binding response OmpR family regulator